MGGGLFELAIVNMVFFPYKHKLGFASSLPRPEVNYLSLAKPLTWQVWIAIIASIVVSGILLNTFYRLESMVISVDMNVGMWKTRTDSVWYCFGVFWGESMVDPDTSRWNSTRSTIPLLMLTNRPLSQF